MNIGSQNRSKYDNCNYEKQLYESTSPLNYYLYQGKYENCNKCIYDEFWAPYELVDIETELKNMNNPLSKCDKYKYSNECIKSGKCLSTFDKRIPVVLAPEVCPIVHNNIPRQTSPGFHFENPDFCRGVKRY